MKLVKQANQDKNWFRGSMFTCNLNLSLIFSCYLEMEVPPVFKALKKLSIWPRDTTWLTSYFCDFVEFFIGRIPKDRYHPEPWDVGEIRIWVGHIWWLETRFYAWIVQLMPGDYSLYLFVYLFLGWYNQNITLDKQGCHPCTKGATTEVIMLSCLILSRKSTTFKFLSPLSTWLQLYNIQKVELEILMGQGFVLSTLSTWL